MGPPRGCPNLFKKREKLEKKVLPDKRRRSLRSRRLNLHRERPSDRKGVIRGHMSRDEILPTEVRTTVLETRGINRGIYRRAKKHTGRLGVEWRAAEMWGETGGFRAVNVLNSAVQFAQQRQQSWEAHEVEARRGREAHDAKWCGITSERRGG